MQDLRSAAAARSCTGRLFFAGAGDRPCSNQALKCPRCDSLNTKFCYYNNYNLAQPRHFCKSCRRYWTKGGVLRNVPVGGGCRNAKRSKIQPCSDTEGERETAGASSGRNCQAEKTEASALSVIHLLHLDDNSFNDSSRMNLIASSTEYVNQAADNNVIHGIDSFATSTAQVSRSDFSAPFDSDHQTGNQATNSSQTEFKMNGSPAEFLDQLNYADLPPLHVSAELTAMDWLINDGEDLFDFPASAENCNYWTEASWIGNNPNVYLP